MEVIPETDKDYLKAWRVYEFAQCGIPMPSSWLTELHPTLDRYHIKFRPTWWEKIYLTVKFRFEWWWAANSPEAKRMQKWLTNYEDDHVNKDIVQIGISNKSEVTIK